MLSEIYLATGQLELAASLNQEAGDICQELIDPAG